MHQRRDPRAQLVRLRVVRQDRVHVDHRLTAERFRQLLLDVVDEVVHLEDIARGGHLGVQRDHPPAGSVVVYDEVMHAADALVRHDEPFDLLYELLLRRLAEQRADRIARRLHP